LRPDENYTLTAVESLAQSVPRYKREDPSITRVVEYHTRHLHRVARVVNVPYIDIISFGRDDIFRHAVDIDQKKIRVKTVGKEGWDNKLIEPKELQMALDFPKGYEVVVVDGSKLYIFSDIATKVCNNWGFSEMWAKNADKVVDTSDIYREERNEQPVQHTFTPGMDVVINPPEGSADKFWLAHVVSVRGSTLRVRWYEKLPLDGRYINKNTQDDIPVFSIFEDIPPNLRALGGNQFMLENQAEVTRLVWAMFGENV